MFRFCNAKRESSGGSGCQVDQAINDKKSGGDVMGCERNQREDNWATSINEEVKVFLFVIPTTTADHVELMKCFRVVWCWENLR